MPIPNPTWGCQERKRVHDPESYEVLAFKSQGHNPEGANAAVWNCQEGIGPMDRIVGPLCIKGMAAMTPCRRRRSRSVKLFTHFLLQECTALSIYGLLGSQYVWHAAEGCKGRFPENAIKT